MLAWSLPLAWSAICLASPTTTTSTLDRVIAGERNPSIAWRDVQRLSPRHGGHHDKDDSATDGESTGVSEAMMSMSAPRPEPTTLQATSNSHGYGSDEAQQQQHGSHGHMVPQKDAHEPPVSSGHDHGHSHGPVLLELNETQILLTHSPDPPSYWDYDQSDEGRPAVLYAHIALMTLSFFGLLPLGTFVPASTLFAFVKLRHSRACSNLPQGWSLVALHHPASGFPRGFLPRARLRPGQFFGLHSTAIDVNATDADILHADPLTPLPRLSRSLRPRPSVCYCWS